MPVGFHRLKISDVRRETADSISLGFDLPDALRDAFAFEAGQHLTLRAEIGGEDVRRSYSLCTGPDDGEFRVAIRHVAGGVFSAWANATLAAGDTIEAMPPHGSFTWTFDPARRATYIGFAGGSGITPILSLVKAALTREPLSRFMLVYGNRASNTIMFLDALSDLKNRHMDRLQVHHVLSEEEEDVDLLNGMLDRAKIASLLGTLIDPSAIDAAFVCGPAPMMDAAEAALHHAGVAPARILIERFTAGRVSDDQAAAFAALERKAEGRRVRITLEGRTRTLVFDAEKGSILENARAAGMAAPFACKAGVCATCRARLVDGDVTMKANYGLSRIEVAQGYVLTCQAVPLTDDVVLDFDA